MEGVYQVGTTMNRNSLGWNGLLARGLALVGAVAIGFSVLSGCGSGASGGAEANTPATSTAGSGGAATSGAGKKVFVVLDKGGKGDKSFNDSAVRGAERAQKELGAEVTIIESKTDADYQNNIEGAAERGADLVIAIGFSMKDPLNNAAKQFPDTKFALVDETLDLPNVRSILFKEEEGSFLVGYVAAMVSKTNTIGFVGGKRSALIDKFYYGYAAGAKTAKPNITVLPPLFTEDWNNQDAAKASANTLFGRNADVVYHAAGRAGLGVIEAAKQGNKLAIGVDSDQDDIAPGVVLTSMIKRVDEAVFATISDMVNGKFSAGSVVYDLKAGGVGTSDFRHTKSLVTDEIQKGMNEWAERIKRGEVTVPKTEAELAAFGQSAAPAAP